MGYKEETTKHFRIYSPEYKRVIRRSIIRVNETIKGGIIDLRLRVPAGPQGTKNRVADRNPVGRPKRDAVPLTLPVPLLLIPKTTLQVVIPAFNPPAGIPRFTEEDMEDTKDVTAMEETKGEGSLENDYQNDLQNI